MDDDVDDFLALQAALGAGPSHLVTTSYGALLALAIAMRSPAQVASLVVAEPPLHRWLCATDAGEKLYDTFIRDVWRAAGQAFEQGMQRHAMQLLTDGMWGRPVFGSWSNDRVGAAMRNASAMRELTRAQDPFPDFDRGAVSRLTMPTLNLVTWSSWLVANTFTGLYMWMFQSDFLGLCLNLGSALMCAVTVAVTLLKRKQLQIRPASPG